MKKDWTVLNWFSLTHSLLFHANFGSGDLGVRHVFIVELLCIYSVAFMNFFVPLPLGYIEKKCSMQHHRCFLLYLFFLIAQVSKGFEGNAFHMSEGKTGCELNFISSVLL